MTGVMIQVRAVQPIFESPQRSCKLLTPGLQLSMWSSRNALYAVSAIGIITEFKFRETHLIIHLAFTASPLTT